MRYIKEYSEHSTYEKIWMFKYGESPTYDKFKTFTTIDLNVVSDIIRKLPMNFFKYRSQPELHPFWFLNWPIWLRDDLIDIYDEDQVKWKNKWKEILDHSMGNYKTDPIYKNKQINFCCQTYNDYFLYGYKMFDIEIMCDDDGYYYVQIDLQGDKKYYKCDQEYGLSDCIKTELKNWKMPKEKH